MRRMKKKWWREWQWWKPKPKPEAHLLHEVVEPEAVELELHEEWPEAVVLQLHKEWPEAVDGELDLSKPVEVPIMQDHNPCLKAKMVKKMKMTRMMKIWMIVMKWVIVMKWMIVMMKKQWWKGWQWWKPKPKVLHLLPVVEVVDVELQLQMQRPEVVAEAEAAELEEGPVPWDLILRAKIVKTVKKVRRLTQDWLMIQCSQTSLISSLAEGLAHREPPEREDEAEVVVEELLKKLKKSQK
jgi:hypothetical protein